MIWRVWLACGILTLATPIWAFESRFYGRVVYVDAGDRLQIMHHGHLDHARLFGVYCPKGPIAAKARIYTRGLANQRGAFVHCLGNDHRGSLLVQLNFIAGENLGEDLVRAGLARWDAQAAPRNAKLARLEVEAKKAHRGLWAVK